MAQKKDILLVKKFKKKLSKMLPINKLIFFGSRAAGKPKTWSDFDLIIVSKKFARKKFRERPLGFHEYWGYDHAVDFLCYTPKEFNKLKRQITIVREAVENGIEI